MKRLLLASVLLLPMLLPAHADNLLTPEEQQRVDVLLAKIDFAEAAIEKQKAFLQSQIDLIYNTAAERERVRISKCTVPMLHIGCPAQGAEATNKDDWAELRTQSPQAPSPTYWTPGTQPAGRSCNLVDTNKGQLMKCY